MYEPNERVEILANGLMVEAGLQEPRWLAATVARVEQDSRGERYIVDVDEWAGEPIARVSRRNDGIRKGAN